MPSNPLATLEAYLESYEKVTLDNGDVYPQVYLASDDLPEGWAIIEQAYKLGSKMYGSTFKRFASLDQVHTGLQGARNVFEVHCEQNGLDLEAEFAAYQERQAAKKQAEKDHKQMLQEKAGKLTGERRDKYIEVFRNAHGQLESSTVMKFRGWTTKWTWLAKCAQVKANYWEPDGTTRWSLMKDLEATLGFRMSQGKADQIKEMVEEALQLQDKDECRNCRERCIATQDEVMVVGNPIMEGAEGVSLLGGDEYADALKSLKPSKRQRRLERQMSDTPTFELQDYEEVSGWGICEASAASKEMRQLAKRARGAFQDEVRLLAVGPLDSGAAVPESCRLVAVALEGLYYEMRCEASGGRHCYRRLREVTGTDRFVGDRFCIFWKPEGGSSGWHVGAMGPTPNLCGYAMLGEQALDPCQAKGAWKILKAS